MIRYGLQWIGETGNEQLHLLCLRQFHVSASQRDEFVRVLLHRTRSGQHGDFSERGFCHRGAKTAMHQLDEAAPRWFTSHCLQAIVPKLGGVRHVESSQPDTPILQRILSSEVQFAVVQPR
uniref:Uncharacterized protein n=1 Tax=Arundo donax TaxID=35708 RepID=A0A0A9AWN3_ARUDO